MSARILLFKVVIFLDNRDVLLDYTSVLLYLFIYVFIYLFIYFEERVKRIATEDTENKVQSRV